MDTIVQKRQSICQRIRNSEIFQANFKQHVTNETMQGFTTEMSNLAHSKARSDSVVHALMRYIMTRDAMLATARDIASLRRGEEEGLDAEAFIELVSGPEGVHRELLAGLTCDA